MMPPWASTMSFTRALRDRDVPAVEVVHERPRPRRLLAVRGVSQLVAMMPELVGVVRGGLLGAARLEVPIPADGYRAGRVEEFNCSV